VPASDSIAVKRIAGPGLALDYYFIIRPEQALAALEAKMELDELQAYQHATERVVLQPQQDFLQSVLSPPARILASRCFWWKRRLSAQQAPAGLFGVY